MDKKTNKLLIAVFVVTVLTLVVNIISIFLK